MSNFLRKTSNFFAGQTDNERTYQRDYRHLFEKCKKRIQFLHRMLWANPKLNKYLINFWSLHL